MEGAVRSVGHLDLIKSGRTEDEAASRLVAALRGALTGWSAPSP